jgi:hypothetical protein
MSFWTAEMKYAASDRMKKIWSDSSERQNRSISVRRPPKCPGCGENDISKFYQDNSGKRTNAHCKECHKQKCKTRWHSKTPIEKQATRVKAMYGISPEEYIEMHKQQDGKCAICEEKPTTKRGLHLDHNHSTGQVRGLLCHGCNVALGSFKENTDLLGKAIEYLRSKNGST